MTNLIFWLLVVALVIYALYRAGVGSNKIAARQRSKAAEFLATNGQRDGVITTASGLQYEVLQPGRGEVQPKATDTVLVHYHGTLMNGEVFDSSVARNEPISFALNQVIPGWTEGLQTMVEGQKTRLFIPPDLAYGNQRAGSIPPGSLLIFDVELLQID